MKKKLFEIIHSMFITKKCIICNEPISHRQKEPLCEDCAEYLEELLETKCKRCAYDREYCLCLPPLIKQIYHGVAVWAVFYNADTNNPINNIVYQIKQNGYYDAIDFCTDYIMKSLISVCKIHNINYSEYEITYPPRKKEGVIEYGFDHTERIARSLGKKLGLKVVNTIKNKGTESQKELEKQQRLKNAEESYDIITSAEVANKKFFIVDDIMTTGATLFACAKKLYANGASAVIPVTYAKDNF